MRVLDLFSGIGGFSLGLDRAGMTTVAFCEIDPYCQAVLRKHWPDVPIYDDVRTLTNERLKADGITGIDLICGGFPCQDISSAGKRAGIEGERSGLWSELARIIGEVRPRYAILENVAALLSGDSGRWFGRVLGDLAEIGYDAEWHCIPASAVGAPHRRDRVWVVADARGIEYQSGCVAFRGTSAQEFPFTVVGDTCCTRLEGAGNVEGQITDAIARQLKLASESVGRQWVVEPDVGRVANGVPDRAHRLKALGNAVVPQIPEMIGRAIMEAHHA